MKNILLHIPEPCHENWDNMTPVDKGRFCQSCAKQVVDFSLMTDKQVLDYFAKATGNTCGRFATDQLQRPLQPLKQEKKKAWWIAAMMPLLMFEKGKAQGMVVIALKKNISGKITNTAEQPVPYASIIVDNKLTWQQADSNGAFHLQIPDFSPTTNMKVSALGYKDEQISIASANEYNIVLNESENFLAPVVVNTTVPQICRMATGGTGVVVSLNRKPLKDTLRNLFFTPAFKIFPNPVQRGSIVNIDVKNEGDYSIQLFDNNGKLILLNTFMALKGIMQTQITIPQSSAAGMYYIRLVNGKTKKQYTDKVIVI